MVAQLAEDDDAGFLPITAAGFDGLIHWQGIGNYIQLHPPGSEGALVDAPDAIRIDLPGHGLSSGWPGDKPAHNLNWDGVAVEAARALDVDVVEAGPYMGGDPVRLFPDLTPDRHGNYLTTAWSIVRARHFFRPWYEASAANATPFDPAAITPERLAREHRALLRATGARALAQAIQEEDD